MLGQGEVLEMRKTVRAVPIARPVQDYAIRIMLATHPRPPLRPSADHEICRDMARVRVEHRLSSWAERFALF